MENYNNLDMQSTELDARIKAGYSILKGKSPEIKVLVNDIIMANSDSQAKAIADSINRVHAVKPLSNNGTPPGLGRLRGGIYTVRYQ